MSLWVGRRHLPKTRCGGIASWSRASLLTSHQRVVKATQFTGGGDPKKPNEFGPNPTVVMVADGPKSLNSHHSAGGRRPQFGQNPTVVLVADVQLAVSITNLTVVLAANGPGHFRYKIAPAPLPTLGCLPCPYPCLPTTLPCPACPAPPALPPCTLPHGAGGQARSARACHAAASSPSSAAAAVWRDVQAVAGQGCGSLSASQS